MQKSKRIISILLTLVLFIFMISCSKNENMKTEKTDTNTITETKTIGNMVKIHYIDVGQGDSELIQVEDKNILIDAGTSDRKALDYLKSLGVKKLDYVIATHPHEDHLYIYNLKE